MFDARTTVPTATENPYLVNKIALLQNLVLGRKDNRPCTACGEGLSRREAII